MTVEKPDAATQLTLCETGEAQIFNASSTTDEFGYGIAVCVLKGDGQADDLVSVVYSGEGGNLRTSCLSSECEGVIEFNRYTRYRFTELTLKWRDKYADNTLIEGFDAQDTGAEPQSSVTHISHTDWQKEQGFDPLEEELTGYEALSLMALERSLPTR